MGFTGWLKRRRKKGKGKVGELATHLDETGKGSFDANDDSASKDTLKPPSTSAVNELKKSYAHTTSPTAAKMTKDDNDSRSHDESE